MKFSLEPLSPTWFSLHFFHLLMKGERWCQDRLDWDRRDWHEKIVRRRFDDADAVRMLPLCSFPVLFHCLVSLKEMEGKDENEREKLEWERARVSGLHLFQAATFLLLLKKKPSLQLPSRCWSKRRNFFLPLYFSLYTTTTFQVKCVIQENLVVCVWNVEETKVESRTHSLFCC